MLPLRVLAPALLGFFAWSCDFDRGDRWLTRELAAVPVCEEGGLRCAGGALERCEAGPAGPRWEPHEDCAADGLVCVPALTACKTCVPSELSCDRQSVLRCASDGEEQEAIEECDTSDGLTACRGGRCVNLCAQAAQQRSNVGCEYWAVDLDNAVINATLNAAAQQFAVVVSNPQPDLIATVSIEEDLASPGQDANIVSVADTVIAPLSLRVFKLGPKEVDGSPPGEFDTGTGTALTRAGYRVRSSVPVVAYQFNPLENVNVFSNDASLLKPREAQVLSPGSFSDAYVVTGWPQTIASTDDPDTNFDPVNPSDLRAFLTIVGTTDETTVRVTTTARTLGGGPIERAEPGDEIEAVLNAFEVLNLETDDFNADFTGSLIGADQPIVVFSGSEASDAPFFERLSQRRCCADHLEEQLDPIRTAGKSFVATVSPNRSRALRNAGSTLGEAEQPEFFRVIAVTEAGARVTTTLSGADAGFSLRERGDFRDIESSRHFLVESDAPVMLSSVSASQDAAGVVRNLPGGDPSFLIVPPLEQFRSSYVFLTPDKYIFDFIRVIAPPGATILFDGQPLSQYEGCRNDPGDGLSNQERGSETPPYDVFTCQLGFPVVDPNAPSPDNAQPGRQNDGVHRINSNHKIGVLVDGFDRFVSYAYAAGTELSLIVPR